jgi:hypothetical protein
LAPHDQYANNGIQIDHGQLKAPAASDARSQAGPQRQGDHRWDAFIQNVRRGHGLGDLI